MDPTTESTNDKLAIESNFFNLQSESIIIIYKQNQTSINIFIVSTTKKVLAYSGTIDDLLAHPDNTLFAGSLDLTIMRTCFEPSNMKMTWGNNPVEKLYNDHKLQFSVDDEIDYVHVPFTKHKNIGNVRLNHIAHGLAGKLKIELDHREKMAQVEREREARHLKQRQELERGMKAIEEREEKRKKEIEERRNQENKQRVLQYKKEFLIIILYACGMAVLVANGMGLIHFFTAPNDKLCINKLCIDLDQEKCDTMHQYIYTHSKITVCAMIMTVVYILAIYMLIILMPELFTGIFRSEIFKHRYGHI